MDKIAIVFSGQGAQNTGMGKDLYENFKSAKEIFEKAEILRKGTIKQCFEANKQELSLTVNTQPCLFTVNLASAFALKEKGVTACGVAGFSLGEVAGLVYSDILSFEEGFKLVCKRAKIMDDASKNTNGGMAAVLKLENNIVEEICKKVGNVYPVNYNCKGQTVIAGDKNKIEIAKNLLAQKGGRVITLAVSGAFHSPLMEKAYIEFKKETENIVFNKPTMPLYSNVTAKPYDKDFSKLLSLQIKSPVLWQKTIENMTNDGYTTFIECGTGKTLYNLIKRINDNVKIFTANNKEEIETVLSANN